MPITKASSSAVAPAAKGDLVVGSATNDSGVLAVGSTDQVLTVDSSTDTGLKWATASAGGMTLLSTTTLSGSSVTLSSIPSTYNDLILIIKNAITGDDNVSIYMRVNGDATASRHRTAEYSGLNSTNAFNLTRWTVSGSTDQSTGTGLIYFEIPNYANTTTWKLAQSYAVVNDGTTPTTATLMGGVHAYNQTGAITSFNIHPSSGNFSSGTVLLYGVK